ncbi:hypothetical protein PROFUN_02180 [Planoprotostelium fungivorum]|uniref:ADF-H domain-containing protein n=1 Tax=Planoprotostelium fungivorum TaxID=1890364 RepID=A0A2P6NZC1_9EUKA|nr:hypothetical protein PROFUN_02180 [Planoprotostelium fungivorum]
MADTTDVPQEIIDDFKKFKSSNKQNTAIIFKVNKDTLSVEQEETLDNVTMEEIAEYMPEISPRFIAYSYKHTHADGRMSLPLVFIYYCPRDISPVLNMLYSSTKTKLQTKLQIMKTFDIQESEAMTTQWLKDKLKFFD